MEHHIRKIIAGGIVGIVIVGGLSFWAGSHYANSRARSGFAHVTASGMQGSGRGQNNNMPGGMRTGQGGAGFVSGTILSKDDQSLTISLVNGGSRIILLGNKTSVRKSVDAGPDDLTTGETVTIIGKGNQDGSLSAESIEVGGMPMMGRAAGSGSEAATPMGGS